jgi:Zn-dependent protease
MLFSLVELLDICIAVIATGYIFMDMFHPEGHANYEPFGTRLLFSIAIAAPAVILHEFGHKFVALYLGYTAIFHASYMWLGVGILLKLISFPFIFVVPAYVSIYGAPGVPTAIVAFAGPAINGILWFSAWLALKLGKYSRRTESILYYTKTINMMLFIFNLIPIPGFDGWNVFTNLF